MRKLLTLGRMNVLIFLVVSLGLLLESDFVMGADEKKAAENTSLMAIIKSCESCHTGQTDSDVPIISGQQFAYLYTQLKDYQAGRRDGHPMEFKDTRDNLQNIAKHFSSTAWGKTSDPPKKQKLFVAINAIWQKYVSTSKKAKISAAKKAIGSVGCFSCHGDTFLGDSNNPRLAGQNFNYLKKTLLDLKYGRRKNSSAMSSFAETVSDDDLEAIASYLYEFKTP